MCAKGTKSQLWKQAWWRLDVIPSVYLKINTGNPNWQRWGITSAQTGFPLWKTKGPKASINKTNQTLQAVYPPDRKRRKQDYLDVNMIVAVILRNFNNQLSFHIRTRCLCVKFRCNSNYTYFPLFSLYDKGQRIYTPASHVAELYILSEASTI